MDFAVNTYMSHAGIRLRDSRPSSTVEKAQSAPDKDKWLPFFPKTKKVTTAHSLAVLEQCSVLRQARKAISQPSSCIPLFSKADHR